ncbi:MAG: HAD-IIIA family hydrolase [Paludibacteraceae bacterium]|nr:HAD-IIIA family hydrolase [Paludibacteraceae bacterium]
MKNYKENLKYIKAFIFDVDGVLSSSTMPMAEDGTPIRTANVKDGYALQYARKSGYILAVITGGDTELVRNRCKIFGITDIYTKSANKMVDYEAFKAKHNLTDKEVIYVGDDLPDIPVLQKCGISVCPADAAHEVKEIVDYISINKGGQGCVRDIIEQTMRAQDKWLTEEIFIW